MYVVTCSTNKYWVIGNRRQRRYRGSRKQITKQLNHTLLLVSYMLWQIELQVFSIQQFNIIIYLSNNALASSSKSKSFPFVLFDFPTPVREFIIDLIKRGRERGREYREWFLQYSAMIECSFLVAIE